MTPGHFEDVDRDHGEHARLPFRRRSTVSAASRCELLAQTASRPDHDRTASFGDPAAQLGVGARGLPRRDRRRSTGCELVHADRRGRHRSRGFPRSRRAAVYRGHAVTEIPEHLLKRSRAARRAGPRATPPATLPPHAAAAAPAHRRQRPARRRTPAARRQRLRPRRPARRRRSPTPRSSRRPRRATRSRSGRWPRSASLPLWAFMYVRVAHPSRRSHRRPARRRRRGVQRAAPAATAATGEGGVGHAVRRRRGPQDVPPHRGPAALRVLRHRRVRLGRGRDLRRPAPRRRRSPDQGARRHAGGQGGGALTDAEILAVVCHERYTLGGADPTERRTSTEYEKWCAPRRRSSPALEDGIAPRSTNIDDRRRRRAIDHTVGNRLPSTAGSTRRRLDADRARRPTCWSSAAARPAPRPPTGWPVTATTSPSSSARRSPARRRAATA